jgi:hypothetical protein
MLGVCRGKIEQMRLLAQLSWSCHSNLRRNSKYYAKTSEGDISQKDMDF